ncbi:helix-turn-helix transcriptional regulator [Actinophytocola sp.]|uniref:helix-turn-helix transcriptional regulator n=1 Tax=Actinophytocola sp. TaxID=1872138 RepID=UPI00389B1988
MSALGEFLRARRELVTPKDVGLETGGFRRVPGLRREEVATLAGISADYYLRLEQGRDRHPSVQVLDALARVLQLDETATAHLMGLGGHLPPRDPRDPLVPEGIPELIDGWPDNPAYVMSRFTDLLAVNRLAAALSPNYRVGVNMLRRLFLDPAEREMRRDWELMTEESVGTLRASTGADLSNPRLIELVSELSAESERFRLLWSRHDVQVRHSRVHHLTHPVVGDLDLRAHKLIISGTDTVRLVVLHADPGSRDAERLARLQLVASPAGS